MATRDKTAIFSSLSRLKQLSDTHSSSRHAASSYNSEQTEQELDDLIVDLRSRVKEQEQALETLRSQTSSKRDLSLSTLKTAYKTRASTLPSYLPPPNTALDTLTAISHILNTTTSLTRSLAHASQTHVQLQALVDSEEVLLSETRELNSVLQAHLVELEETQREMNRGGSKVRAEKEKEARAKAKETRKEAGSLLRELKDFIDNVLTLMITAEDAGGPVVGEQLDRERLKELEEVARRKAGKKNQPTIEQMWGAGDDPEEEDPTTQFKTLLEAIMNAASEPNGSPYVEIRRESAASRFLVRTGIARFHPRDARKLKLVDFGRTLEDG